MITIEVPIPHRALNPNGRSHWRAKSSLTSIERQTARLTAMSWLNERMLDPPRWAAATIQCTFYFATKRRRDKDNAEASLKATRDGLADAGIVANDAAFTSLPPTLLVDKLRPRVVIEIREGTA